MIVNIGRLTVDTLTTCPPWWPPEPSSRPPPHPLPFPGPHKPPHCIVHRLGPYQLDLPGPLLDHNPHPQYPHHRRRVCGLVRVHGPRGHRHSTHDALQARVPPAVAHEPTHRPVAQYPRLGGPPPQHHPSPLHPLLETLWRAEPPAQPAKHITGVGIPDHPEELGPAPRAWPRSLSPARRLGKSWFRTRRRPPTWARSGEATSSTRVGVRHEGQGVWAPWPTTSYSLPPRSPRARVSRGMEPRRVGTC
ncbi:hypothetical protein STAS_18948, partial [Striga asiatica]